MVQKDFPGSSWESVHPVSLEKDNWKEKLVVDSCMVQWNVQKVLPVRGSLLTVAIGWCTPYKRRLG